MEKKFSWTEIIATAANENNEETITAEQVLELISQASEEDRKKILDLYSNLLGEDYAKDMVKADMDDTFREIFSSWSSDDLKAQYNLLKTAMDDEDEFGEESAGEEGVGDYDEDHEELEKEEENMETTDATSENQLESLAHLDDPFDQLMRVIASWEPKDRKAVFELFKNLLGNEYSTDSVKDYNPKGKARDVSSPQSSGQVEASSDGTVKTASAADRNRVADLWRGVLGANFVGKMTELYKNNNGKTVPQADQSSGQTKTSSFDPWGLNKESKKKLES